MPTQKWCSVNGCKKFIFVTLDSLYKYGWSAFQIPTGNGKVMCFCQDHQKEMKEVMKYKLLQNSVRGKSK